MEIKKINNNGYDYVDLGLPSGTLWATMNVGANKPEDFGFYFQWGGTQGYTNEQVGKDKLFNWDDYKWYDKENDNITKYTSKGEVLDLEDDAAHVHMGGDWHMPTDEQIKELIDNTKVEWIKYAGVKGMAFTSKKDSSKFIFIPAAGEVEAGSCYCVEQNGYIWSSTMSAYDFIYGKYFNFCLEDIYVGIGLRYYGLPVRGVIDKKQDNSKFKKEDKDMIDKLMAKLDNEIKSLQERIDDIKKKKNACLTDDYSKMYVGKYVKITRKELPYIKECIYVRNVYTNTVSDKLALTLQGQGFCYSAGDYLDEIEGNFSETSSKTLYENWINDGLVKVDIISKDEYKKEVNKMVNFILNDFDDVETIE